MGELVIRIDRGKNFDYEDKLNELRFDPNNKWPELTLTGRFALAIKLIEQMPGFHITQQVAHMYPNWIERAARMHQYNLQDRPGKEYGHIGSIMHWFYQPHRRHKAENMGPCWNWAIGVRAMSNALGIGGRKMCPTNKKKHYHSSNPIGLIDTSTRLSGVLLRIMEKDLQGRRDKGELLLPAEEAWLGDIGTCLWPFSHDWPLHYGRVFDKLFVMEMERIKTKKEK